MKKEPENIQERYDYGKYMLEKTPHESHAAWDSDKRIGNPVELIEEQNVGRVHWLVPERRERMSKSAFTFFRGAARIMAWDLSLTPCTGMETQLCGDAHLSNFGVYASPERRLVFDLNDFDETLPGPWEWDVKRLATSLFIAGRHNDLDKKACRKIARRCASTYRKAMSKFAEMRLTDIWYTIFEVDELLELAEDKKYYRQQKRLIQKAKKKDSRHALDRLAEYKGGKYRIKSDPPFLVPARDLADHASQEELQEWVINSFDQYKHNISDELAHLLDKFKIVDFAFKVVGVGSVGTRCAILLLQGSDENDPLFLQIKQANQSVLEEHLPKSQYSNSRERVVQGQRLMQAVSDLFLGWNECKKTGNHYYWRQLKDWKGSADVEDVNKSKLKQMATLRGWNLARAHARTGDAVALSSYLESGNTFPHAIAEFASRYNDQNEKDYQEYLTEIQEGRLVGAT